jgi:hypothetical protein
MIDKLLTRTCRGCNEPFQPSDARQEWCNARCRDRHRPDRREQPPLAVGVYDDFPDEAERLSKSRKIAETLYGYRGSGKERAA